MQSEERVRAPVVPLATLAAREGEEVGVSDWMPVTQDMIDAFAELTGDDQFIHVDPARAAETPFGGTIAHGFLTLSLLARFAREARPRPEGLGMSVNYGFDRIRFIAPVPSGSRVRGRFRLTRLERDAPGRKEGGQVTLHWSATVEVEGAERPALVADWITRAYLEGS